MTQSFLVPQKISAQVAQAAAAQEIKTQEERKQSVLAPNALDISALVEQPKRQDALQKAQPAGPDRPDCPFTTSTISNQRTKARENVLTPPKQTEYHSKMTDLDKVMTRGRRASMPAPSSFEPDCPYVPRRNSIHRASGTPDPSPERSSAPQPVLTSSILRQRSNVSGTSSDSQQSQPVKDVWEGPVKLANQKAKEETRNSENDVIAPGTHTQVMDLKPDMRAFRRSLTAGAPAKQPPVAESDDIYAPSTVRKHKADAAKLERQKSVVKERIAP